MQDPPAAELPLHDDLVRTHRALVDHLAGPGSWWSGAERVAIAAESRAGEDCALCRARKGALSPEHGPGEHDRVGALPAPLVELAHRIRTDPARLSRSWFEDVTAAGVCEGPYVEAVGIVAIVAGMDSFCRALGRPPYPLPEPVPGDPSGHRPANAKPGPGWVSTLAPEHATGEEADLYSNATFVPYIRRALSLVPADTRALQSMMSSHYVRIEDVLNPSVGRDLDRMQMELVAARLSALNECFY